MKKVISLVMAMAMVLSMGAMSFADVTTAGGTGSSDAKVNAEAATFSVTVPTDIVFSIAANGDVTAPTNVKIINNSYGAIKVTNLAIANAGAWEGVGFDAANMPAEKVGAKKYAISLNGDKMTGNEAIGFNAANWAKVDGVESGGTPAELAITVDGKFAPQKTALSGEKFATVTFTVAWDE